jgi:hypothetical protein
LVLPNDPNDPVVFYTNIYVLAYNQNASPETIEIYNQMVANIKFNKNIMNLFCLKNQYEAIKEKLRRDTIRKADYYQIKKVFENFSGNLSLQAGTYVPGMSISTWPSWSETLGRQLGAVLPVDPLNVMAVNLVGCTNDSQCGAGQCAGGYCSLCPSGYDARTCWNERTKDYKPVDGFVYKYQNNVLTIRYEYPQLQLPETDSGNCFLGCIKNNLYYNQGSCLSDGTYCDAGLWPLNSCGDGEVRCNERCDYLNMAATDCFCAAGCLGCKQNFHSEGTLCVGNTVPVDENTQTLSVEEQKRWTGDGISAAYAISCKPNAIINNKGVCVCKTNYHEEIIAGESSCQPDSRTFACQAKPEVGAVWNTVESYTQNWDGEKWLPFDDLVTEYNTTASDNSCRYKCAEFFSWGLDTATNVYMCKGENRPMPCAPKPANNTVWNNGTDDGHFTQVWTGTAWLPETVPTQFNELAGYNTCNFKCETNYSLIGDACVADTKTFTCPAKLPNTDWNTVSSYTQTWDGEAFLPADSLATFDEEVTQTACHYICQPGLDWDGTTQSCTKTYYCSAKPDHSYWYYLDSYTQYWTNNAWDPVDKAASFNSTTPSSFPENLDCIYKCDLNFTWEDNSCVSSAVCGDGIVQSPETCDSGSRNGDEGFCNITCTGTASMGASLFLDNFTATDTLTANWQIGYCPTDSTTNCAWSRVIYPSGSGNYVLKNIGGTVQTSYPRDIWLKSTDFNNLVNVDVRVLVNFVSTSFYKDSFIIVRRTAGSTDQKENYYGILTNNGTSVLVTSSYL